MLQSYKYEKLKVRDFADFYLKYGRIKTRNHMPYLTYLTKPRVNLKLPNWTSISRRLLVSGKRVLIKTQDKANVVLLEMKASNIPEVDRILKISNKLLRRQVSPKIFLSYKEAKKYIGRGTTNRPADENEDTDNEIEEIDQTPKKIVDFVELTDSSDDEPLSKTFKIDNNCQSRLRSSRKTKNFYKCQDEGCDKAFASEASLKKHRLDHIILFQCLHCKRKFMSQKNLSQHQESYHKNKTSKSRKIHNRKSISFQ